MRDRTTPDQAATQFPTGTVATGRTHDRFGMAVDSNASNVRLRLVRQQILDTSPTLAMRYTAMAQNMFAANASGGSLRRRRSGRLDTTRMTQTLAGDDRAFYRRIAPRRLSRRVILVLDLSGSMCAIRTWSNGVAVKQGSGSFATTHEGGYAMLPGTCESYGWSASLIVLQAMLCRASRVEFEVWGFSSDELILISDDQDVDALVDRLYHRVGPMGGNQDEQVMHTMLSRAWRAPETDVLVMYFSDGGFYATPLLVKVLTSHYIRADRMAEQKRVRLVGIGVGGDDALSRWGLDAIDLTMSDFDTDVRMMLLGLTERLADPFHPQRPTAKQVENMRVMCSAYGDAYFEGADWAIAQMERLAGRRQ